MSIQLNVLDSNPGILIIRTEYQKRFPARGSDLERATTSDLLRSLLNAPFSKFRPNAPLHVTHILLEYDRKIIHIFEEHDISTRPSFPTISPPPSTPSNPLLPPSLSALAFHFLETNPSTLGDTALRICMGDFHPKAIMVAWPTHRIGFRLPHGLLILQPQNLSNRSSPDLWERAKECIQRRDDWKAQTHFPFTRLPTELQRYVLEYIHLAPLSRMLRVCRDWYQLILDLVYRSVHFPDPNAVTSFNYALNNNPDLARRVHQVSIHGWWERPTREQPTLTECLNLCHARIVLLFPYEFENYFLPAFIGTHLTQLHLSIWWLHQYRQTGAGAVLPNLTHLLLECRPRMDVGYATTNPLVRRDDFEPPLEHNETQEELANSFATIINFLPPAENLVVWAISVSGQRRAVKALSALYIASQPYYEKMVLCWRSQWREVIEEYRLSMVLPPVEKIRLVTIPDNFFETSRGQEPLLKVTSRFWKMVEDEVQ